MEKPKVEGFKEIGRWLLLYVISFMVSWFVTSTLAQISSVPETLDLKIWVFTYLIPVREAFAFILTLVSRGVDKYLHELGKEKDNDTLKGGLTKF